MPDPYFPPCCSLPSHDWLLPRALPQVYLSSSQFDPQRWTAEDFTLSGIPPARGLAKRQSEFLAGRLCAREALACLTQQRSIPAVGEDGAPQWPAGVVGSITHGAGLALAVVGPATRYLGLGLDIEKMIRPERALRLAGEILTANELQRLQQLPVEEQALCVTLTFSLKESLFKALYPVVRKRFYFHDAELLQWDDPSHTRLRLLIDLSAEWTAGREAQGQFVTFDDRLLSLVEIPAG